MARSAVTSTLGKRSRIRFRFSRTSLKSALVYWHLPLRRQLIVSDDPTVLAVYRSKETPGSPVGSIVRVRARLAGCLRIGGGAESKTISAASRKGRVGFSMWPFSGAPAAHLSARGRSRNPPRGANPAPRGLVRRGLFR
jgi:hypothetical protein